MSNGAFFSVPRGARAEASFSRHFGGKSQVYNLENVYEINLHQVRFKKENERVKLIQIKVKESTMFADTDLLPEKTKKTNEYEQRKCQLLESQLSNIYE